MANWRRLLIFFLFSALLLSGCWNRRDPELLGIVIASGFEWDPQKELYQIFVQVANPLAAGGQAQDSGSSGGKKPFWVLSAHGHTPFEARKNLELKTSRELFWAHNGILLLGENLARKGILPILDLFERDRQLRLITRPMVVEGDLSALLEAEFPLEETSGQGLRRQILAVMFERNLFPVMETWKIIATLERPGAEMIIGRVQEMASEGEDSDTGIIHPAKLSGGAAFVGDRMVGWLGEREVAGWNWIWGEIQRATQVVLSPIDQRPMAIEIYRSHTRLQPRVEGDNVTIKVQIEALGMVQDQSSPGDLFGEQEMLDSLNKRTATVIKNDVEAAMRRAQELNSDFLQFGNLIYRKLPQEWERLEPRWQEIFPNINLEVEVTTKITRAGLSTGTPTKK